VGLERHPLNLARIEELLGRKSSCSGLENRYYGRKGSAGLRYTPLSANVGTNLADNQQSLGRYSSLEYSGHGGSPPPYVYATYTRSLFQSRLVTADHAVM
jgi:hypothetical protein